MILDLVDGLCGSGGGVNACRSGVKTALAHPFHDGWIAVRKEATGVGVQRRNARHVSIVQLEVKHCEVLCHALFAHGLGQRSNAALKEPAQNHLPHGFAMVLTDGHEHLVLKQVVAAFGKRCPSLRLYAQILHEGNGFKLLLKGVYLDLIDRRCNLVEHLNVHESIWMKVADANARNFRCL